MGRFAIFNAPVTAIVLLGVSNHALNDFSDCWRIPVGNDTSILSEGFTKQVSKVLSDQ
jgi:hypothetical protein